MTKVSREYVMNGLKEILVDALGIDEDEIKEEARISSDLGAESIDYLDIVFRAERKFDIKIPSGEMFPDFTGLKAGEDYLSRRGFVSEITQKGLRRLIEKHPYIDYSQYLRDDLIKVEHLNDVSVKSIANYLEGRLNK